MGAGPDIGAYEATPPVIDIEKSTNGFNADTPTGPVLLVGTTATFDYVVTNPGIGPISNVTVTDNQPVTPVYVSGDTDGDTWLDAGETWLYTASTTVTAGQYSNIGTATGDDATGSFAPPTTPVSDTDPSHHFGADNVGRVDISYTDDLSATRTDFATDGSSYFGALVAIDIEKLTNGVDGAVIAPGAPITFTYDVTNTGNVPLDNVDVEDDNGTPGMMGDDFNPDPILSGGFNVGDVNTNGLLDPAMGAVPAEVWQYDFMSTAADLGVAIDFETDDGGSPLAPGTVIDDEYEDFGLSVSGGAEIFDSSAPSLDLAGMVTLLELNEPFGSTSTIAIDTSGHIPVNNGTLDPLVGGPTWTGGTLDFDGVDDRVLMPASSDINMMDVSMRSVFVRFKADNAAGGKQVVYEEGSTMRGLNIYIDSGQLYVGGWNFPGGESGWTGTYLNTSISSGVWHELVLVLNGGLTVGPDALKGYLDGNLFGSGSGSQVWTHSGAIGIGATNGQTIFHDGSSGVDTHHFDGEIDEIRISNPANFDMGTPNEDFGGPGVGAGGAMGALGENRDPQDNVLFLDPSGTITFDFATPSRVNNIGLLDIDSPGSTIELYDSGATLIGAPIPIPALGENSFQILVLNTAGVSQMKVIAPAENFAVATLDYDRTFVNEATTSGTYNPTVEASDTSSYLNGLEAVISIEKWTAGLDADTPPGPTLLAGDPVTFNYLLRSIAGDVPLDNIVVTDDAGTPGMTGDDFNPTFLSGDLNSNNVLDLNELWIYQEVGTVTPGQHTNIGEATGQDQTGMVPGTTTDEDPSNHFGADPQIELEKLVSIDGGSTFDPADSAPGPSLLSSGSAPVFRYEVTTGSGNVDISNVTVTDSVLGPISGPLSGDDGDGILEIGETWIYEATGTWAAGQQTNTGTAEGDFTDDLLNTRDVDDTDDANYFGAVAEMGLTKLISIDGGSTYVPSNPPTQILLESGADPMFRYEVTIGTGNVPMSSINVYDTDFGTHPRSHQRRYEQ